MIEFGSGDKNMKTIYTFTLNGGEDAPEGKSFDYHVRMIAFMLYTELINYDDENIATSPLNVNANITVNNIISYSDNYKCILDSDVHDENYINYEPFILGRNTFGLTIDNDNFTLDIMMELLDYVIKLLNLPYKYEIEVKTAKYKSKNVDDESNRDDAISSIADELRLEYIKRNTLGRRLIRRLKRNKSS